MDENQYNLSPQWLFIIVIIFTVVVHMTITLQYSAFFHIYYDIAQKYEQKLHTSLYRPLKPSSRFKEWFCQITHNPWGSNKKDDEHADEIEMM